MFSSKEQDIIDQLTQASIVGYNKALQESLKIGNKIIRVGVYGILTHKDEVLMVRTQSGSQLIYNFPGGGVDENEGFAQALIRECQEEINVDVTIKQWLYAVKNLYMHKDFPEYYMFNIYYSIEVADKERFYYKALAEDAKWFSVADLPLNEMLPIDKEFIDVCF